MGSQVRRLRMKQSTFFSFCEKNQNRTIFCYIHSISNVHNSDRSSNATRSSLVYKMERYDTRSRLLCGTANSFDVISVPHGLIKLSNEELLKVVSLSSQFGDPILLLFESNIQGFLAFPKPSVGSSQCDDRNAAGMYVNQTEFEMLLLLFPAFRI